MKTMKLVLFAVAIAATVGVQAQARSIVTAWNTRDLSGNRNFSHLTFTTPWGFATPQVDDIISQPISATGLVDSGHPTALIWNNVPTTYDLNHYLDLVIRPKAGLAFDPSHLRVASSKSFAPQMNFELRTSLDNFTSLVGTGAFNNSTTRNGSSYTDLEVDLSSLADLTGTTTFRLYMKDSDGTVSAVGSTATWPYGFQIYGDSVLAPIPSAPVMGLVGLGLLAMRRQRR